MKLCRKCMRPVDEGARNCSRCGADQRSFFARHKVLIGVTALTIAAGAMSLPNGAVVENEVSSLRIEQKVKKNNEFVLGDVISKRNVDLMVDNPRIVNILPEKEFYVYDITALSKLQHLNLHLDVQGVTADNEVVKHDWLLLSSELGDPVSLMESKTLMEGQKAKGFVAFDKKIEKIEIRSEIFGGELLVVNVNSNN